MAKVLYLVTEGAYFLSHRLALAKEVQRQGHDIIVLTVPGASHDAILSHGFRLRSLAKMTRSGMNPIQQLQSIFEIFKLYRKEKPDIVHHVAMKPVVYGTIAARMAGVKCIINALTGLGFVFISKRALVRILRLFLVLFFRIFFMSKKVKTILQNKDDFDYFSKFLPKKNLVLIRGSGVDTKIFFPKPLKQKLRIKVVLAARLLWDKGVGEAIEAVQILKDRGHKVDLVLAGKLDPDNPSHIEEKQIKDWVHKKLCVWKGHVQKMHVLYQSADIALLPSYREGLPKSLLEAAACGVPMVSTDVPGCREIVRHGKSGLLVPPEDGAALAEALEKLIASSSLRKRMGAAGRKDVEKHFSDDHIIKKTISLYGLR